MASWQAVRYGGMAVVLAVGVAFPGWPAWVAAALVIVGYVVLLLVSQRAIDDHFERLSE